MSKNVRYLLLVFFNCLCVVIFLMFNIDMLFGIAMLVWMDLIVYAISKFNERSVFLGFLITFFVFLMGRQMLEVFGLHKVEISFPNDIQNKAELTLLISLIGLFLGYVISGYIKCSKIKIHIKKKKNNKNNVLIPYIRKVSNICFRITYFFAVLKVLEAAVYVSSAGYLSTYTSYSSKLPYIVQKLAEVSPILMFVYLGTLPSKKECKINIFLYGTYLLLTLTTGRRYECIGGLLLIVVYYALRDKNIKIHNEKWIGKKEILFISFGAIGIIIVANIIGTSRFGINSYKATNGYLLDFIYQQGVSIGVIKRYMEYGSNLPKGKLYFIGSTLSVLARSPIGRLFNIPLYGGNTVENAMNGFSFAHALSYLVMDKQYLNGNGMGSSYIAEIMYSFGYTGIFIANIFYGVILRNFFRFKEDKVWNNIIIIIMMNSLFFAPRGSFDAFFADLLSVNVWETLIFVYLFANILNKNRRKNHMLKEE